MQIRFKKFTPAGTIQFQPGELVDIPAEVAQIHVDEGNAVAVPKAESAALRFEPAPGYRFPTVRPAKKTRR